MYVVSKIAMRTARNGTATIENSTAVAAFSSRRNRRAKRAKGFTVFVATRLAAENLFIGA